MRSACQGLLLLAACSSSSAKQDVVPGVESGREVLATIGGRVFTEDDLTEAILEHYDDLARFPVEERKAKVLDVLVQTATLAAAQEMQLSEAERRELALDVAAYREKLLIEAYLAKHNTTPGVTDAQVRDYYQRHPEKFGAQVETGYQLLHTTRSVSGAERASIEQAFADARRAEDWAAWITAHSDLPVAQRTGASAAMLHPRLRQALDGLVPGQASEVISVQGIVMLGRVTTASTTSPRPLLEVEHDIRRMLAPAQMSKAIEAASTELLKHAKVEYR